MRPIALFAAAILSLASAAPALAGSLAAYGKLPAIEDVEISPDGKRLAMIRTDGEKRVIVIYDWDAKAVIGGVNGNDTKVRDVQWADNNHVLITISQTTRIQDVMAARRDWAIGFIYDVTTRKQTPLMGAVEGSPALNVVLGEPTTRTVDGAPMAFFKGVSFASNQGVQTVFRTNLTNGRTKIVATGDTDTRDFLIGGNGDVVAEVRRSDRTGAYALRLRDPKGNLRNAPLPADLDGLSVAGFSQDGTAVLVRYSLRDGPSILAQASLDTAAWPTVEGSELQGAMFDHLTERMIGFSSLKGDVQTFTYANPADQKAWTAILKAFPGQLVEPVSASANRRRVVVMADSPTEGPAYMLVDLDTSKATVIGSTYPDLKPADIAPVRPITYKAADGKRITGYLTLPPGKADKNLPLIVLPHGGPASRDTLGFSWWPQALASRGYAVLQPNFRGSSGFGRPFLESGFGEFGRKMQTDLSDGVRDLAAKGVIDPKRVCIVGASYGGYAALAGATLDTGVYRCAASVSGPADLRRMLITERNDSGNNAFQYWKRFMGVEGLRDPDLAAISPAAHANAVTIPLLLVHGKDDTVVLYEQSRMMADAMKKAGKPVTFVTLPGEDHWLSRGATRLQMLEAVTEFIEKNNPPG